MTIMKPSAARIGLRAENRTETARRKHQTGPGLTPAEGQPLAVHHLNTAEALIVWGVRYWVDRLKAKADPIPLMLEGFASGGVAAGQPVAADPGRRPVVPRRALHSLRFGRCR